LAGIIASLADNRNLPMVGTSGSSRGTGRAAQLAPGETRRDDGKREEETGDRQRVAHSYFCSGRD